MAFLTSPDFWIALSQIILINIVLSGDNAVVIALACRSLPPTQQKKAIIFGSTVILKLMNCCPIIITAGAALLGWVAGEMAVTDPAIHGFVEQHHYLHTVLPVAGVILGVAVGKYLASRSAGEEHPADQPA